ncbi:MAG: hypothetical protein NBV67_01980, partial [Tagaea sp.]|nr:hypothetical protein [Tagaea sp.]
RFPGVREVRVLHELDRDDDASSVPPILSMAFADRQALDVAPDLDVRRTSREVARGLLEMWVRHHVFDAAPADPLDRR